MARRTQVFKRLEELGWRDDIKYLGRNYEALPDWAKELINEPIALTEQGKAYGPYSQVMSNRPPEWPRIRSPLEDFLSHRKVLRLRMEERDTIASRIAKLISAMEEYHDVVRQECFGIAPLPLDMINIPRLSQLLTSPSATEPQVSDFRVLLPGLVADWREERAIAVLSLLDIRVPQEGVAFPRCDRRFRNTPRDGGPLLHREALFWCNECGKLISALLAMTHQCCYDLDSGWSSTVSDPEYNGELPLIVGSLLDDASLVTFEGRLPWNPGCLSACNELASQALRLWQSSANSSPDVANTRMACRRCSIPGKYLVVMRWQAAVHHMVQEHRGIFEPNGWCKLPASLLQQVNTREHLRSSQITAEAQAGALWTCLRCPYPLSEYAFSRRYMMVHLEIS
ncbi:hypothetical protein C8Q76DRAFT_695126 [Earliella scabrosa]|nr:hypothetical protein C8Q76DRAFT_695126 [Earliella scabrosa]